VNDETSAEDYWLQIGDLRVALHEGQELLAALHTGQVDGVLVHGPHGVQIYSLKGADDSFRLVMECMNEGAMILTEDGGILYGNRTCAAMLDCALDMIVGTDLSAHVAGPHRARLTQLLVEAAQGVSVKAEIPLVRNDGRTTPVQLSLSRLQLEDTAAISAVLTDLTESKQAMAALHKLEQLASVGRMAAQVAHEINGPLAGIKNAFELLKRDLPDGHRYAAYVPRIEQEIDRIARIVRQTFDMSRPENEVELQALERIVHDVAALQGIASERQAVRIEAQVEPQCANLPVPGHPLRQILYNLIRNALDLSPEGGVVRVTVCGAMDGRVLISVIDEGPGIPEDVQPHIFKPFFSTKTGARTSGMGLGLSICHDLATHLGGTITFTTEPGQGTEFRVELPREMARPGRPA
jgi:PAS domain S-box-containing protein